MLKSLDSQNANRLNITRCRAVTATARDKITLLRRRANAARTAAETRTAAFRFALVILEHEEIIRADFYFGTQKRLIRSLIAPVAHAVIRNFENVIIGTHRLVVLARARTRHNVIRKSLRRRVVRVSC